MQLLLAGWPQLGFDFKMAHRNLQAKDSIKSLKRKIKSKEYAPVRDRLRAVLWAIKGMKDREIAEKLGFSVQWVALWIGRYKKGGVEGLFDRPRLGAEPALNPDQIIKLYSEILAGPDPDGPLSRYRISDIREFVRKQFGVEYSMSGMHALMKRMKLSHMKPRPSHPKNDPQIMEDWKKKSKVIYKSSASSAQVKKSKSGSKTKPDSVRKES